MLEGALVIDHNDYIIKVHLPEFRTSSLLPHSDSLWWFLWEHRDRIKGIAHTHPAWAGVQPSITDLVTFRDIDNALGCALKWWVVGSTTTTETKKHTDGKYAYYFIDEPEWAEALRILSSMPSDLPVSPLTDRDAYNAAQVRRMDYSMSPQKTIGHKIWLTLGYLSQAYEVEQS